MLDVHQLWTNLGFMVFFQRNRHATNLSPTVLIGRFWAHIIFWNIIELTPKSIPFEAFDEIHNVVLDRISVNMASLVH